MFNLKRRAVVLAVLAIAAIGGIGVAAPAASAGNCPLVINGQTNYIGGKLQFAAIVGNCSSVSKVQFGNFGSVPSEQTAGYWFDADWNQTHLSEFVQWVAPATGLTQTVSSGQNAIVYYNTTPWCNHGTHWISTTFTYRLQSVDPKAGLTWGPWHRTPSNGYQIVC